MTKIPESALPLVNLQPTTDFFVGIDSDGCAFDSMEIKHKECFIPNIIKYWGLQAVSKYAREAAEFVNLYSQWRGANRWPALVMVFDLLRERPEVVARHAAIPEAKKLRQFINSGFPLSDSGLRSFMEQNPDSELDCAMEWSKAVNRSIEDIVHGVPPFPYVRESLKALIGKADVVVVSATPTDALNREWQEHQIAQYARIIAGQEMGKKEQHLEYAAKDKYPKNHILMIGDALGDFKAAKSVDALFFPINPGHEVESWQRLFEEGIAKFVKGSFAGEYETGLLNDFEKLLPNTPPWKKK